MMISTSACRSRACETIMRTPVSERSSTATPRFAPMPNEPLRHSTLTELRGRRGGGGGPGGGGMMMSMDSGDLFEFLAKGRTFFLINETRTFRDPLTQYAQEKGIVSGQINRSQFMDFHTDYKKKMAASGGTPFGA